MGPIESLLGAHSLIPYESHQSVNKSHYSPELVPPKQKTLNMSELKALSCLNFLVGVSILKWVMTLEPNFRSKGPSSWSS